MEKEGSFECQCPPNYAGKSCETGIHYRMNTCLRNSQWALIMHVSVQFPGIQLQYWTFHILFISSLRVFTIDFESMGLGLIPSELQRLGK